MIIVMETQVKVSKDEIFYESKGLIGVKLGSDSYVYMSELQAETLAKQIIHLIEKGTT